MALERKNFMVDVSNPHCFIEKEMREECGKTTSRHTPLEALVLSVLHYLICSQSEHVVTP